MPCVCDGCCVLVLTGNGIAVTSCFIFSVVEMVVDGRLICNKNYIQFSYLSIGIVETVRIQADLNINFIFFLIFFSRKRRQTLSLINQSIFIGFDFMEDSEDTYRYLVVVS